MAGALIFDIDGTLLQSDPLHEAVFRELLAEYGLTLGEGEYHDRILGRQNRETFAHYLPDHDALALDHEKEARFRARLTADVPPTAGLPRLLDRADEQGWKLAVVTNAMHANAEAMLGAIGLRHRFPVVVAEGDAPRPKPFPDLYQLAARRIDADPARTLVFEDSLPGVTAAVAAGLTTIGLRSNVSDAALRGAGATMTIQDFTDPALEPMLARLNGVAA